MWVSSRIQTKIKSTSIKIKNNNNLKKGKYKGKSKGKKILIYFFGFLKVEIIIIHKLNLLIYKSFYIMMKLVKGHFTNGENLIKYKRSNKNIIVLKIFYRL